MRSFLLSVLVLTGCESGLARDLDVSVPSGVRSAFSETSRGVLVVQASGEDPEAFVVLCGQSLPDPLALGQDLGFGCLRERASTSDTVRAWIQPMPEGWAGQSCSTGSRFNGLSIPASDAGVALATEPDSSWAQGSVSGEWARDGSICGGVFRGAITVGIP